MKETRWEKNLTIEEMKQFLREWLEALRSGKYPQTKGHLRDDTGFCCLGVLCDLYNPSLWAKPRSWNTFYQYKAHGFDEDVALLPAEIARKLGMRNQPTLSSWNDQGWTFDKIAEAIEDNPSKFFEGVFTL